MSSIRLIARRTPPSGSCTAVALIRAQRISPGLEVARAEHDRLGIQAREREPAGQAREVQRAPELVRRLEATQVLRRVEVRQVRARPGSRSGARRPVGVDQLVVRRLDGDRVRDVVEHHAQLVGEQRRAPARTLERGDVLEGHHGDVAPTSECDRRARHEHGPHAAGRFPVDLDVAEHLAPRRPHRGHLVGAERAPGRVIDPVRARVLLRRHAQCECAAGEAMRRGVRVEDPRRSGLDEDHRHRQHVEDGLDIECGRQGGLRTHRLTEPTPSRACAPKNQAAFGPLSPSP